MFDLTKAHVADPHNNATKSSEKPSQKSGGYYASNYGTKYDIACLTSTYECCGQVSTNFCPCSLSINAKEIKGFAFSKKYMHDMLHAYIYAMINAFQSHP